MTLHGKKLDYALILGVGAVYAALLPEAPDMDGVRWAASIERGEVEINPNYLLMQPLMVVLFGLWSGVGLPGDATAFAKGVDVVAGCVSLAVFAATLRLVRIPDATRAATLLLLAFSHNFLVLATSDHVKLLTAPVLLGTLHLLIAWSQAHRRSLLLAAGVCLGLSVCTLVNAAVWAVCLVPTLWLIAPGPAVERLRAIVALSLAAAVPALVVVVGFYAASDSQLGFVAWLTSYGADPEAAGTGEGYGAISALTIGRFVFSVIKNLVHAPDVSAWVKALLRGGDVPAVTWMSAMNVFAVFAVIAAYSAAGLGLLQGWRRFDRHDRQTIGLCASMIVAYAAFGLVWNDSDAEFWFQMTAPFALVLAILVVRGDPHRVGGRHRALVALTAILIVNQLITLAIPRAAYPYDAYVAEIEAAIEGCDLIVYDDDRNRGALMWPLRDRFDDRMLSVMVLAREVRFDADEIRGRIEARIESTLSAGGSVCVLGIHDASDHAYPWANLSERIGLTRSHVIALLERFGPYVSAPVADQTLRTARR